MLVSLGNVIVGPCLISWFTQSWHCIEWSHFNWSFCFFSWIFSSYKLLLARTVSLLFILAKKIDNSSTILAKISYILYQIYWGPLSRVSTDVNTCSWLPIQINISSQIVNCPIHIWLVCDMKEYLNIFIYKTIKTKILDFFNIHHTV